MRRRAAKIGGRQCWLPMQAVGQNLFGEAVALATSTLFGVGGGRIHYLEREEWVDTVYMGAWPRQVFDRIGPFDEEQVRNQDDEFNYRLLERGGRSCSARRSGLVTTRAARPAPYGGSITNTATGKCV